jgi:hypothetical protein
MSEGREKRDEFKQQLEVTNGIIKNIQKELKEVFFYSEDEWCEIRQELVDTLNTIKKYKAGKKKIIR